MLKDKISEFESAAQDGADFPLKIEAAKNSLPTASENGIMLHSKYNPEREAEGAVSKFLPEEHTAAVFFACGLGYTPIAFCKKNPSVPVVIIEEKAEYIFQAFTVLDWEAVLQHPQIVFLINAPVESAEAVLAQYDAKKTCIFAVPSQTAHSEDYFKKIKLIIAQQKSKDSTNTATLEKFAHLWLSNSCRNLRYIEQLDGVAKYADLASLCGNDDIPFVVLAAGPSLERILPHLAELKKCAMIICVDTALHACLSVGVEPDFIVLVDPQFACAMHLEFLSAPSSVLVTEIAAWPSVFRFPCKEKVLCTSMYPPGQYFEKKLGIKGILRAGGSVTTTAWDLALSCGAKEIFLAGMDLGFPGKQTHIRGSQFEELAHRLSNRIEPAETKNTASLISASPLWTKDYDNNDLLSDKKMALFSWWFEKNCSAAAEQGVKTYSLTSESLAIKGIEKYSLEELLQRKDIRANKELFFKWAVSKVNDAKQRAKDAHAPDFEQTYRSFVENMDFLVSQAKRGISLCEKAAANRLNAPKVFAELAEIDNSIMKSEAKEAAELVFPTEQKLKELTKDLPEDQTLHSLFYSRIIYTELKKAAEEYLKNLSAVEF